MNEDIGDRDMNRDELYAIIQEAAHILWDVHSEADEIEHQITCHADTLVESYRKDMELVQKVHELLTNAVNHQMRNFG